MPFISLQPSLINSVLTNICNCLTIISSEAFILAFILGDEWDDWLIAVTDHAI